MVLLRAIYEGLVPISNPEDATNCSRLKGVDTSDIIPTGGKLDGLD